MSEQAEQHEEVEATDEEQPKLDPEVLERRRQALQHVRQFGDPVLKTRAHDPHVR